MSSSAAKKPLWSPTPQIIKNSNMYRFMQQVSRSWSPPLASYKQLHHFSVSESEKFWEACWHFFKLRFQSPPRRILHQVPPVDGKGWRTKWFEGAQLNYAENLLYPKGATATDLALISVNEASSRAQFFTYETLRFEVAKMQEGLRALGLKKGDRLGAYLPNIPEAVLLFLAASGLGIIFSSCSPDFGAAGLVDRFGQIKIKALFTVADYSYKGRNFSIFEKVAAAVPQLVSLKKVVLFSPQAETTEGQNSAPPLEPLLSKALAKIKAAAPGRVAVLSYDALRKTTAAVPLTPHFEPLPFDYPLYILYSSGTTGPPKCLVHSAGGSLLKHLTEHQLHTDLKPKERLFFYTTCGWMMWNWLVSALASRVTIVLYEGNPFYPLPETLLRLAQRYQFNVFGAGASYYAALPKALTEEKKLTLPVLRLFLSTGAPLAPSLFEKLSYSFRAPEQGVRQVSSISGGTDIVACFALGCPLLPVYRGELQCCALGAAVKVYDDAGRPVLDEKGELVCENPIPSMPLGFENDPNGERYFKAYFSYFPKVWRHGDYAELTSRGSLIIYGRSDTTLNPGGVRIGTAEIYRQVEQFEAVAACLAVEQKDKPGFLLFLELKPQQKLNLALKEQLCLALRRRASVRHVPRAIIAAPALPRTVNGKISEAAAAAALNGASVKNLSYLANPECLAFFSALR